MTVLLGVSICALAVTGLACASNQGSNPKTANAWLVAFIISAFTFSGAMWIEHSRNMARREAAESARNARVAVPEADCTLELQRGDWTPIGLTPDGSGVWLTRNGPDNAIVRFDLPEECR